MEDPYADYSVAKREWIPQMHRRSLPQYLDQSKDSGNFHSNSPEDSLEFLQRYEANYPEQNTVFNDRPTILEQNDYLTLEDLTEMYPVIKFLNDMHLTPREIQKFLSPENYEKLRELLAEFDRKTAQSENDVHDPRKQQLEPDNDYDNSLPDERFTLTYNTPDNFRAGWESRDALPYKDFDDIPESRVYIDEEEGQEGENTEYGSGNPLAPDEIFRERKTNPNYDVPTEMEIFRELERENNGRVFRDRPRPGVYTEGGVVWSPTVERNFIGNLITRNLTSSCFHQRSKQISSIFISLILFN